MPPQSHGMVPIQWPKKTTVSGTRTLSGSASPKANSVVRPAPSSWATQTITSPIAATPGTMLSGVRASLQVAVQACREDDQQGAGDHRRGVEGQDLRHQLRGGVGDRLRVPAGGRVVDGVDHAAGDDGGDPGEAGAEAREHPPAAGWPGRCAGAGVAVRTGRGGRVERGAHLRLLGWWGTGACRASTLGAVRRRRPRTAAGVRAVYGVRPGQPAAAPGSCSIAAAWTAVNPRPVSRASS